MTWLEFINGLVGSLVWPLTFLLVAAWLLRRHSAGALLGELKGRIQSLKAGPSGFEASFFEYGRSEIDSVGVGAPLDPDTPTPQAPQAATSRWDRVGNLFWLANDLMWVVDVTLRGASPKVIATGLRSTLHHLTELNLATDIAGQFMRDQIAALDAVHGGLGYDRRTTLATQLLRMTDRLGRFAVAQQKDHRPSPFSRLAALDGGAA
jgi:hypothetical protein